MRALGFEPKREEIKKMIASFGGKVNPQFFKITGKVQYETGLYSTPFISYFASYRSTSSCRK